MQAIRQSYCDELSRRQIMSRVVKVAICFGRRGYRSSKNVKPPFGYLYIYLPVLVYRSPLTGERAAVFSCAPNFATTTQLAPQFASRASRHCMLALLTLMTSATKITLYTHTACPFAQRVWIALEHTQVEFVRQDVNLYGSGGFDKRALKQVEERGGLLPPKGYIPVLAIGDDLFRESDHCVRHRVETQGQ